MNLFLLDYVKLLVYLFLVNNLNELLIIHLLYEYVELRLIQRNVVMNQLTQLELVSIINTIKLSYKILFLPNSLIAVPLFDDRKKNYKYDEDLRLYILKITKTKLLQNEKHYILLLSFSFFSNIFDPFLDTKENSFFFSWINSLYY